MVNIHFDCLITDEAARLIPERIEALSNLLIRDELITGATAQHDPNPVEDPEVVAMLKQVLADAADETAEDAQPHFPGEEAYSLQRFTIEVENPRSVNQVAMLYAKLFNGETKLPADPAQLIDEQRFEPKINFPWQMTLS